MAPFIPRTEYGKKLLDPRWQKLRLEVFEKADFACEMCGDTKSTLHAHHKQYEKGKDPWEYEPEQLVSLCHSCHENTHACEDELSRVISYAFLDGPRSRDECAWLLAGFLNLAPPAMPDTNLYKMGQVVARLCGYSTRSDVEGE